MAKGEHRERDGVNIRWVGMLSLVTGATGFLGSRLAHALTARGERVRALVRASSDRRRLTGLDLEWAEGDVTDRASVQRAVRGVDRVFHCAAVYEMGAGDPERMRAVNVAGTQHVLSAAAEGRAVAVHVSSVVALGPTGEGKVGDESHWAGDAPRSPYEATKREAHLVARQMARAGSRVRIALPVTIYGPDDPSLTGETHKWIARGAMRVAALAEVPMTLVHVDDCAEALALLAERGKDGEEYVLADRAVTFREWFTMAASAAGRRPPSAWLPDSLVMGVARVSAVAPPLVREGLAMSLGVRWAFRGDKARRELGWAPRPLEDGLRETMSWYRAR
jgi:dihydroflavonol-4-reductase